MEVKMAIQDAVKTIVESLVTHPDEVLVTCDKIDDGRIRINIIVNPEDRGRVIGKQGKTINALRTVIKAAAVKTNQKVNIKVVEEEKEVKEVSEN
jgi:hypothetical protein